MRVIGYIDSQTCKITVFKTDTRFVVKFEDGMYEQTFKFRYSDHVDSLQAVQNMIDAPFRAAVEKRFAEMREDVTDLLERFIGAEEELDDEIII